MPAFRNDSFVGLPIIRVKVGLLPIDQRNSIPPLAGAFAAAITDLESKELFAVYINGDPHPLLILFATNKAPHFIGFGLQA